MRDAAERVRAGVLRRPRGRHPPGPARAGHRLGRHPAPSRRPRHRRRRRSCSAGSTWRTPARWYIGRLAVEDEHHTPLVVDWRAPVAEPFYRATAVAPMDVVRRRHLITRKGREVIGLDDEVFDQRAIDGGRPRGHRRGRAARRARTQPHRPHGRHRRHDPGRAGRGDPRRPARRRSSSPAGPAPGKTAVALHRAAYLLYTLPAAAGVDGCAAHRAEPGVPPLHRAGAAVARRAGRAALDDRRAEAAPAHARRPTPSRSRRSRATRRMAERHRAARSATANDRCQATLALVIDGLRLRITRGDTARIVEGARRRRGTHNEQRPHVAQRFVDLLVGALQGRRWSATSVRTASTRRAMRPTATATSRASSIATARRTRPSPAALVRGEAPPEGWERRAARPPARRARGEGGARPHVAGALRCRARQRPVRLHRARRGRPDATSSPTTSRPLLHRRRDRDVAQPCRGPRPTSRSSTRPTRLLGPVEAARPRRRRRRDRRRRPRHGDARHRRPGPARLHRRGDARRAATATDRANGADAPSASRARSGTCSSTRPRTSPRCSGACSPAAARRAR